MRHRLACLASFARPALLGTVVFAAAVPARRLAAQQSVAAVPPVGTADARTPLGVSVSASGGSRDTLGLLVVSVTPESPADRAGISEGNRLAAINGVSLRLAPSDVGQAGSGDALVRRLDEEIQTARPGEPLVLLVLGGGRRQLVTIPTNGSPTSAAAPASAPAAVVTASPADAAPAVTPTVVTPPVAPSIVSAVIPGAVAPAARAPVAASAAASPSDAARSALAPVDSERAASLGGLIERMGELQQQLHRLARDERSLAMADSLSDAEEDLAALRHRLRGAEARLARADSARDDSARAGGLPGLRLAPVNEELAAYFGSGSARGLLVVQASAEWDPVRSGDVVLRVDGAPATVERLRVAFDPHRRSTIELLRRRRALTVTLH